MENKINKKEFAAWFSELEKVAKSEYRIGNLKKKDFEKYFLEGKKINEAIETFLN